MYVPNKSMMGLRNEGQYMDLNAFQAPGITPSSLDVQSVQKSQQMFPNHLPHTKLQNHFVHNQNPFCSPHPAIISNYPPSLHCLYPSHPGLTPHQNYNQGKPTQNQHRSACLPFDQTYRSAQGQRHPADVQPIQGQSESVNIQSDCGCGIRPGYIRLNQNSFRLMNHQNYNEEKLSQNQFRSDLQSGQGFRPVQIHYQRAEAHLHSNQGYSQLSAPHTSMPNSGYAQGVYQPGLDHQHYTASKTAKSLKAAPQERSYNNGNQPLKRLADKDTRLGKRFRLEKQPYTSQISTMTTGDSIGEISIGEQIHTVIESILNLEQKNALDNVLDNMIQ